MLKYLKDKGGIALFNFNKELLIGEIGSLIGTQLFSFIAFKMGYQNNIISLFTLVGGIIGMNIFWVVTRIHHQKKQNTFSKRGMFKDAIYFAPMATIVSWGIYQPILFFMSRHLLEKGFYVSFAVLFSQFVAFSFFLIFINIFRLFLKKVSGKVL